MENIKYIVVLQCHIVMERCSGFFCEDSFHKREGGFSGYPKSSKIRYLNITCGGCCGRATLRKLSNLLKLLPKNSEHTKDNVMLHFGSCICKENFHGPPCPHYDYLKTIVERKELKWMEGTRISKLSEKRRNKKGKWSK